MRSRSSNARWRWGVKNTSKWAKRREWELWDAPINAVSESRYQEAIRSVLGNNTKYGYARLIPVRLFYDPDRARTIVRVTYEGTAVGQLHRRYAQSLIPKMLRHNVTSFEMAAILRGGSLDWDSQRGAHGIHLWNKRLTTDGFTFTVARKSDRVESWPPSLIEGTQEYREKYCTACRSIYLEPLRNDRWRCRICDESGIREDL